MHVISSDRALAHWRALLGLPREIASGLTDRLFRERPGLLALLTALSGVASAKPGGPPVYVEASDPRMTLFEWVADHAALLAELMRREAGRPLRGLTDAELIRVRESCGAWLETLAGADRQYPRAAPNLFAACSQPELLRGVSAAVLTSSALGAEEKGRACLLFRMVLDALHQACQGEAPSPVANWDAERIIVALSAQGDPVRREALAACESFRTELTAEFIAQLESWATNPEAALEEDGSLGMPALFLLARWREDAAWSVFRKLFSLPSGIGYDLLGDLITGDGSILLAMVGGKRQSELRAMAEDETLDEDCRNACIDALTSLVAWGELARTEHVAWLRELLTGRLRGVSANKQVLAGAVSAACDVEAWELRPEVEAAYARGVVDEDFVGLKSFLDEAAGKRPSPWQAFQQSHALITDVADSAKWLDNPPPKDDPPLPPLEEDLDMIADSGQPCIAPPTVGRNDPCPCGSGKKFKKCCGG